MNKEDKEKVFDYMINVNERNYNILKIAEECQELSLILIQSLSKGVDEEKIIEEIGDVKFRLKVLESYYDSEKIKERINKKLEKNLKYINEKKYKNI